MGHPVSICQRHILLVTRIRCIDLVGKPHHTEVTYATSEMSYPATYVKFTCHVTWLTIASCHPLASDSDGDKRTQSTDMKNSVQKKTSLRSAVGENKARD